MPKTWDLKIIKILMSIKQISNTKTFNTLSFGTLKYLFFLLTQFYLTERLNSFVPENNTEYSQESVPIEFYAVKNTINPLNCT